MTCTVYVPVNTRPSVVHAQYFSHFMTVQMACTFPISLAFSMWEEVAKDKNEPIVSFQCVEHPFSLKYFHSTFCIFLRLITQTFTRSLFIESSSDYLTMKNVDRKKEMDRKSQVWGSLNVMLLGWFFFSNQDEVCKNCLCFPDCKINSCNSLYCLEFTWKLDRNLWWY